LKSSKRGKFRQQIIHLQQQQQHQQQLQQQQKLQKQQQQQKPKLEIIGAKKPFPIFWKNCFALPQSSNNDIYDTQIINWPLLSKLKVDLFFFKLENAIFVLIWGEMEIK
jgi:hypothetical protein